MKALFNSRRHQYLARISILLIMVTLIAGIGGCLPAAEYTLSISSTLGGTVAYPGIGTFIYPEGGVVLLMADPDEGYSFTHWSGHVSTVANVNAATTTITMYGHYFITANFVYGQLIRTWYDLDAIRNNLTCTYTLMNDLSSTTPGYEQLASPTANGGKGWQPIGNWSVTFNGTFNSQGHEISDMFVNRPDESPVGLFAAVDVAGVIQNVKVMNANVTGDLAVGGLIGWNEGTVSNSYATGRVTGGCSTGGLVGYNVYGTVSNSYSTADVAGSTNVGGLIGVISDGTVSKSYATGNVSGDSGVGGLIGYNGGTVSNSYTTGNVTGDLVVGGLIGGSWGNVTCSYSAGNVTGNNLTGGLIGDKWGGIISHSFWDTETSGHNISAGGAGKNTTEMQDIVTFSGALWNIVAVTNPSLRNLSYIWNMVNNVTYPFLSWQPVS